MANALAVLMLASFDRAADARGAGFGAGAAYFAPGARWGRGFNGSGPWRQHQWWSQYYGSPQYDGYGVVPPYFTGNVMSYTPPAAVYVPPEPQSSPSCQRSQEIVTVPSEDGGTAQITVRRCYP